MRTPFDFRREHEQLMKRLARLATRQGRIELYHRGLCGEAERMRVHSDLAAMFLEDRLMRIPEDSIAYVRKTRGSRAVWRECVNQAKLRWLEHERQVRS